MTKSILVVGNIYTLKVSPAKFDLLYTFFLNYNNSSFFSFFREIVLKNIVSSQNIGRKLYDEVHGDDLELFFVFSISGIGFGLLICLVRTRSTRTTNDTNLLLFLS